MSTVKPHQPAASFRKASTDPNAKANTEEATTENKDTVVLGESESDYILGGDPGGMARKAGMLGIGAIAVVGVGAGVLASSQATIDVGEVGVTYGPGGLSREVHGPGLVWHTPVYGGVRTWSMKADSYFADDTPIVTKDKYNVQQDAQIPFSFKSKWAADLIEEFGSPDQFRQNFVQPAFRHALRTVAPNYTLSEMEGTGERDGRPVREVIAEEIEAAFLNNVERQVAQMERFKNEDGLSELPASFGPVVLRRTIIDAEIMRQREATKAAEQRQITAAAEEGAVAAERSRDLARAEAAAEVAARQAEARNALEQSNAEAANRLEEMNAEAAKRRAVILAEQEAEVGRTQAEARAEATRTEADAAAHAERVQGQARADSIRAESEALAEMSDAQLEIEKAKHIAEALRSWGEGDGHIIIGGGSNPLQMLEIDTNAPNAPIVVPQN